MNDDDLRDAAERLASWDRNAECVGNLCRKYCCSWSGRLEDNAKAVAEAYLKIVNDDSDHPITEEWLLPAASVGLSKRYCLVIGILWACPPCGNLGWHWSIADCRFNIPAPKNRGEARQLFKSLGIGVKI